MKRLVLLDWDGIIEIPNEESFNIIIEAGESLAPDNKKLTLNWQELFKRCQGTTEIEFVRQMASQYEIERSRFNEFFLKFIEKRTKLIKRESQLRNTNDKIYIDTMDFLKTTVPDLKHKPEDTVLMLVTGNPRTVMEARIPDNIRPYFVDKNNQLLGAFGDEGENRQSLISLAIKRARSMGFRVARR